jgi:hypothetical protein
MSRRCVIGLVLAAVTLSALLYWRAGDSPPDPFVRLPDAEDIESITAQVYDNTANMGIRPVPEFSVPREHFPLLLSVLTPAKRKDHLREGVQQAPALGHLRIRTKAGGEIHIALTWLGLVPLVFSVDGVVCSRGGPYMPKRSRDEMGIDEGVLLQNIIDAIYWEGVKGHQIGRIPELRRLIERSTGKAPPHPAN